MPKLKKQKFYSRRHRGRLIKEMLQDIELGGNYKESENLSETRMSECDNNSNDRQLQINEDIPFNYNKACNRSIQEEVEQEIEEEQQEVEEEQQEVEEEQQEVEEEQDMEQEEETILPNEYDSEDSMESERDVDNEINIGRLQTNLVQWSHANNICISAVTNLLHVLRTENCMKSLPQNGRTLLKTPRKSEVFQMEHGLYCHFGIEKGLQHIIELNDGLRCLPEEVHLSVNIDGLPLAKSSKSQLWPILGSFRNFINKRPFLIGAFHGYGKPPGIELYLRMFIEEAENLIQNGFTYAGKNIPFIIDCFICDAPARAYVCSIKSHSGFYGCPKCETKGIYQGKVVFPEMNASLRTKESFINQTQIEHHTGVSPLLKLNIDMISQFPHDYMHLVLLGQVKKMLKLMTGKLNPMKLGTQQVLEISRRQLALRTHIPLEFARKPRALDELDRMKATEYREFLLYTGLIVLRKVVRQDIYEHFLKLSIAIRILATPEIDVEQNRYAKNLLQEYFTDFLLLYGINNATYNTHGLLHLADDALQWGALDKFSAFIFENYLQEIKKIVRKSDKPLQQISNRVSELRRNCVTVEIIDRINTYKLRRECYNGLLINDCRPPMYTKIQFQHFTITTKAPNNCCIMKDDSIVMVENICHRNNSIVIIGKLAKNGKSFFNSPAPSTCFGIVQFPGEYSSLRSFPIENIKNKGVVLPIFEHRHNNIMSSRFCIVHFMEENTVEVVPDFWICTSMDTCCWPNTTFPKKNVVRRTLPNKHWKIYKCRVLSTFDDFDTAQSNLKDAEISSDFPSKNVKALGKRLSKRNRKYYSNSNSSDETESCTKKKATFLHNASKPNFTSTSATSNSSNDEEEKENTLPKKPNVQLPKAFAVTNEKVVNANCEAPRKKITFSATKSPQNYRNSVTDDAQPGCSKNMYQEEQRIISSIPRKETLLTTSNYIGESEFEKLVIRDLIKIKFDVKEIRDVLVPIVQDILNNPQENFRERNIRHARQEEELENILPTFPFTIMQDWYDLETLLSNNTVACEQLEKMFSTRGGKDGNDMIRRILGAVFSPQLSAMISWQGRKNNIKLQGTIVARTIFVIVKKKFKMDDRQIELTVINWFRRSSERIKKNPEINNAD